MPTSVLCIYSKHINTYSANINADIVCTFMGYITCMICNSSFIEVHKEHNWKFEGKKLQG